MEKQGQLSLKDHSLLMNFKGVRVELLVQAIKNSFRETSVEQKHRIRQRIFESEIMKNTKYLSCQTKSIHNHTNYIFSDEFQAAILLTCSTYHSIHIRYLAEQITEKGEYECKQCKTKCLETKQIAVDGLHHAFYDRINNYQGSVLIVNKREIGDIMRQKVQKEAEESKHKTMIVESKQGANRITLIEVKVLQIVKDLSLQNLQIEQLSMKLEKAKGAGAQQFRNKHLRNLSLPVLTNSICFNSLVRICNPLIHKQCRPSTHANKLMIYSYQNVYHKLFSTKSKEMKINCRFPGCQNYFSRQNFEENAIVVEDIQRGFYTEKRENLMGLYFMNAYYKNWHLQMAEDWILQTKSNSGKLGLTELRSKVDQLVSTTNLREGVNKSNKIIKKIGTELPASLKLAQEYDDVIVVSLGEFNVCPVRCIKCGSLDSVDIYLAAFLFSQKKQRKCPLCLAEHKKKQFYDVYYVDLQLMQFIYLHGFANQIYFDFQQKQYFHKMQHYTGLRLGQKLKSEKRMISWQGDYQLNTKLNNNQRYVAVVDQRCKSKSSPKDIIKHFSFFTQEQEIKSQKCRECGVALRADRLLLCEELILVLKKGISYADSKLQRKQQRNHKAIASLKQYSDIEKQQEISKDEVYKFYWKNQQGGLIKYPFVYKACAHPFETKICDFADILYQSRTYSRNKFKCRFYDCQNQYQSSSELQRVDLEISQIIEGNDDLKNRIITNGQYWITYSRRQKIIATSTKMNKDSNQQQQFNQRSRFRNQFNTISNDMNSRQITIQTNKIQQEIAVLKKLLLQLQPKQSQDAPFQAQNSQKLRFTLLELHQKRELLAQRQQQLAQAQKPSGNLKSNKLAMVQSFSRKFPNQLKQQLLNRKQNIIKLPAASVSFQSIQTQGNLLLFQYPVKQYQVDYDPSLLQAQLRKLRQRAADPNKKEQL